MNEEVDYDCAECTNPVEPFLRMDRMPHIWCPGCGIGTTVNCFTRALLESKADLDKVAQQQNALEQGVQAAVENLKAQAQELAKTDPAQATKLYNQVKQEFPDAAEEADQGLELLNAKT